MKETERMRIQKYLFNSELLNLTSLFISKAGGIVVNILFLPLYSHILGVSEFAVLVVILSLQALMLMLDFGMSTIVSREISVNKAKDASLSIYVNALLYISLIYLLLSLLLFFSNAKLTNYLHHSLSFTLAVVVFLWMSTLQNITTTALISLQQYKSASSIQGLAVFIKAVFVYLALKYIQPSVMIFLLVHICLGVAHLLVLHSCCWKKFASQDTNKNFKPTLLSVKHVAVLGAPLFIFGLSGALALQADKIIIAHYMSAGIVASYFFAMTFCMTPLAIFGGPITQYFQPKIITALFHDNELDLAIYGSRFVYVLLSTSLCISLALVVFRDFFLGLWLVKFPEVSQVSSYVKILMPGLAVGALGFIPFVYLTAVQDFRFQSLLSVVLTFFLIGGIFFGASKGRADLICYCYSFYHAASTLLSWSRALSLPRTKCAAKKALQQTIGPVILFLILFVVLTIS